MTRSSAFSLQIAVSAAILALSPLLAADEKSQKESKGRAAILEVKKLLAKAGMNPKAKELAAARAKAVGATKSNDVAALAHYYIALVDYRRIPEMQKRSKEEFVAHLDATISQAEKAVTLEPKFADAHALHSSLLGQKIGADPSQTMVLGPRSSQIMARARTMAPENPRVLLLDSISKFHTPEMWGGGKPRALEGLKKAVEMFAAWKPKSDLQPAWGLDEAHAWLGYTHLELGQNKEAREALQKALEINPDFQWVKRVLLPRCKKS